jgi:adenylate cyclase
MSSLPAGKVLRHYQILEKIGEGGMGEVYKAEDLKLGRLVAVKVLPARFSEQESVRHRFLREARAASALIHPNIVTIYSIEEIEGHDLILMEYVEGENLHALMQRGVLDFISIIKIGAQIADGLSAAHSTGLIHRDIKPSNILITPRGQVKILDFGVAKTIAVGSAGTSTQIETLSRITATGVVIGTIAYMSPEQTRGEPVDPRSDIFSLGVVLYEATMGRLPFSGPSALMVMHQIATAEPALPSTIREDLPAAFDRIIQRCLAKEKEFRYSSALELQAVLQSLLSDVPGSTYAEPKSAENIFVGRHTELGHLEICLQKAMSGSGKVTFISGEAGIGKTALTEEFVRRIRKQYPTLTLARGRCVEQYGTGEAYRPFLDAIASLLNSSLKQEVAAILRAHAPLVCLQFPTYLGSGDSQDILQLENYSGSKNRMVKEMRDAFEAMLTRGPLIILLEDLHWADPSSVDLLQQLGEFVVDKRVLVIGTFRAEEVELSNQPLKVCILEMQSRHLCEELPLKMLTQNHLKSYIDSRFTPNDFPTDFVSIIGSKTEGHPLFAVNLIQYLEQRGDIINANGTWTLFRQLSEIDWEIPQSVASMIGRKIAMLHEDEQKILEYASVQGEEFLTLILAKVLPMSEVELEERLNRIARTHHLIEPEAEEEFPSAELTSRYRFVHVLYQNILYERLANKRRIDLHKLVGAEIISLYGKHTVRMAAQLALHFERGRDFKSAIQNLIRAAENAAKLYAHAEAEHHYTHALRLIKKLPLEDQPEPSFKVTKQLAQTFLQAGDYEQAIQRFEECLSFQKESIRRAEIYLGVAQVYQEKGESERAIRQLEITLTMLGNRPPDDRVSLIFSIAFQLLIQVVHSFFPRFIRKVREEKLPHCEKQLFMLFLLIRIYYFANHPKLVWAGLASINLAERLKSDVDLSIACGYYGAILMGAGFLQQAEKHFKKSLELAQRSKDAVAEAIALGRFGGHALFCNQLAVASFNENRSVAIFKKIGELWELQTSLQLEATSHFLASEFEMAEELFEEMGSVARKVNAIMHQAWSLAWAPFCRYLLGGSDLQRIRKELMKAVQLSAQVDDLANQCVASMHLSHIAVCEEEPEEAARQAKLTFEKIIRYKISVPFVQAASIYAAEAALYALENEAKSFPKEELLHIAKISQRKAAKMGRTFPYLKGPSMRIKARLVGLIDGFEKADPIFANAAETLLKTPNRWETGLTFLDWAVCVPNRREECFAKAEEIFEEIQASSELRRLKRLNRSA